MTILFPGDLGHEPPLEPPCYGVMPCPNCGSILYEELVCDLFIGEPLGCTDCMPDRGEQEED